MEHTFIPTETLLTALTEKVLPSYTNEELAKMTYDFRHKNWTSQGTYIYVKHSPFTKSQQNTLRGLIEEKLYDKFMEVYEFYHEQLTDEILENYEFDSEVDTDEYYEELDSYMEETQSLNNPFIHFCLMCVELLETYVNDVYENGETELQNEVDEIVDEMNLSDDYGWVFNEKDDEDGVVYTFDFDYDTLTYQLWLENKKVSVVEFKENLEKKFL